MHPGRADVIGAGALVLRVIMERAGMTSVVASEHDILDGIAWSLQPALTAADPAWINGIRETASSRCGDAHEIVDGTRNAQ